MKNNYTHLLVFLLLFCATGFTTTAQLQDYADTKEKVYVHTNHVFFKQGETLFFKAYIVKASNQTPSSQSGIVYVDIIGPSGNLVKKLQYPVTDGYAEGSFTFDEQAPGGVYTLKAYTNWMRNENDSSFFTKTITVQKLIAPRILMKLDFLEKGYGPGNVVTARFSMRSLNDIPINDYPAKFAVSIGGSVVETTVFKTDTSGKALVKFTLPNNLQTTDGLLNITVSFNAYTEAISRSIPIVLNKIDLQFMPEGGSFIEGLATQVAFRAVNEHGKSVDVKGDVVDNKGNTIAHFESYQFGMGKFAFTPQPGTTYQARITTPSAIQQTFVLPAALPEGVVMNIAKEANQLLITLNSTNKKTVHVTGTTKNNVYYNHRLELQKGANSIPIDEQQFPTGIARFTVYGKEEQPLAERIVFLNEQRKLRIKISPNKQMYQPREQATFSIKTTDENGAPLPANLSLAVVDDKLWTLADDKQDHIVSWLLMSSELSGKIEEPNFYFKKDEPKAIPALDLVMLTHGYRYFDYSATVQQTGELQFLPEHDNMISGAIHNTTGKSVKASVYLINPYNNGRVIRFNTTEDGLFFFTGLSPRTTYYVLAQSTLKKEKIHVTILERGVGFRPIKSTSLKEPLLPGLPLPTGQLVPSGKTTTIISLKDLEQQPLIRLQESSLDETVVIAYGTTTRRFSTGNITTTRSEPISGSPLLALQGRIPGVEIKRYANSQDDVKIELRGVNSITPSNTPLIVINGVPVEQFNMNALTAEDVYSITVLKDADGTAIYGSRGAAGVILIETKKFTNGRFRFNLTPKHYCVSEEVITAGPPFDVPRRFYVPQYTSVNTPVRTDFRETIYWNPVIETDKTGTATVQFTNSDASTTFRAIAEGIGYNGKTGRAETTYVARTALTVDAKIPPYLTVGDKALLPLVVKNNTPQALPVSIYAFLPDGIKVGTYPITLTLLPDSAQQINIPVTATTPLNDTIQFTVETGTNTEKVALPITVARKGFEVIQSFCGNQPATHHFAINKPIPGSARAQLKLYTSLEGQLLDDIESMLREPHGCFEQTSSSTYPNIFILKYLRESGKSNPAVEKKALRYIENGYNRLIGFETAQQGFEWFGNTPPHEALTAYGLLEFTDMQEFIEVDKKMLARTKAFLLKRRDGKGGFKLTEAKYGFAGIPEAISHIYIVYALTQAGIGQEIQPEYQAAVKKALDSNDTYQLSLMALAASNMHHAEDYHRIMTILNEQFRQGKWKAATSLTHSSGKSLEVETMALYAMALMRDSSPQMATVANILAKIMGEKTYYGYGATQATVLALQAIVQYSKLTSQLSGKAPVYFTLNDKTVTTNETIATQLQEGNNQFMVTYGEPREAVPYNLEVAYHTFTPPNSDKAALKLSSSLNNTTAAVGETVRMQIAVTNTQNNLQAMSIAKVGIPAGLSAQPWQLKEIMEKHQVAYYEIFDNYLVLYWMGFAGHETKTLHLDLKAEIAGTYKGKASTTYLYYQPEDKNWNDGLEVTIY